MSESTLFHHRRVVRFGECDPAGVAYYPVFFDWFHQAMEVCFEERLGVSYANIIQHTGFPAVHTSADFHRPLAVGRHIDVVVGIERLGRSSIEWRFDIQTEKGTVAAVGRVKTVCIAVSNGDFQFSSTTIPEELRPHLETLLIIENH